mmetsp:Transcript_34956/g.107361  ORF Transcript_34956/g.107361 Transcript_34956/m.107361 type:complete len:267 (+) Transcript_34956:222-1022(+)
MSSKHKNPVAYFGASAMAAVINFPLWKASAMAQAGFEVPGSYAAAYLRALRPPYKGVVAVVGGMTWARGAIFYGSDAGRAYLESNGVARGSLAAVAAPPLVVSTLVQIVNQPIIRGSVMLQNPKSEWRTLSEALRAVARDRGAAGLWHGTSAGILKTVPKYSIAIIVKDEMERRLPPVSGEAATLGRAAVKACAAAIAGALVTNPLDVIRNEMFKTDLGLVDVVRKLEREQPRRWVARGADKNLVGVAVPVACTIFFTDLLRRRGF